jgi:lipoprotein signal peptidase
MDNCSGENKNNMVLCFLSWLVEKGYFEEVQFAFFLVGHTKNVADRLFNILMISYLHLNIFSMKMLIAALNTADQSILESVTHEVFKDYDKMFNSIYKDLDSIKKWQIFKASKALLGPGKIEVRSSNLEDT